MSDYFEIDFLAVGKSSKSGDAIPIRYSIEGVTKIHIVDGGFQETGSSVIEHLSSFYDDPSMIDAVIVTHPDGDHAGGLRTVLEQKSVSELWMLRPWLYADELIERFARFTNVENLKRRLREIYPNIAALEDIALEKGIPIKEPFQGAKIGAFHALAPSKERYLDLVEASEKTPESSKLASESFSAGMLQSLGRTILNMIKAFWGDEVFSSEDTSAENDMSVVQYAMLSGKRILLTGDAGRSGLEEAADYAEKIGINLPGVDRFQVPHHGSRRNVSTEVLDRWLGERLAVKPSGGDETFFAIISAAKDDDDHPRKAVVRAMIHRGGKVFKTKGNGLRTARNAPDRSGWSAAEAMPYPEEQED